MNRKMLFLVLAVSIYCSCSNEVRAQQSNTANSFAKAADQFYGESLQAFSSVPGFSIVVVKDQEIVYQNGFGYADLSKQLKATPQTNFYIASSTKSFTGLLASILDQEGVIKLDDPLTKYFPETNFASELEANKISIRDLFTHTSGLNNSPIGFRVAYSGEHDLDTRLKLMNHCVANKVGKGNFSYTNVGYNIYAIILEKVTGKNWKDWLEEKIFNPLGMNHTTGYISKAEKASWPMALPYLGRGKDNIQEVYLKKKDNTMQAAGGLITTGEDLAKWLKVQINNGSLDGKKIFPDHLIKANRSGIAKGSTPSQFFKGESYGMGWQIGQYEGEKVVWHFGGFPGFLTHISYMPEKKIGVAVMVNEGIAGNRLKDFYAAFAYNYLLGKENTEEQFNKMAAELSTQLKNVLTRITNDEAQRAKREWQLSMPLEKYTGTFKNEYYGTVEIKKMDKNLHVRLGNLHCIPTPYTQPETIRVELIPGTGEVILFEVANGIIKGFNYDGDFFEKI